MVAIGKKTSSSTKSIKQYTSIASKRISLRLAFILAAALAFVALATMMLRYQASDKIAFGNSVTYLDKLIRVHDYLEASKYLDILVNNRVIGGYKLVDRGTDSIMIDRSVESRNLDRWVVQYPVDRDIAKNIRLYLYKSIDLTPLLIAFSMTLILSVVLWLIVRNELHKFRLILTAPLGDLEAFVISADQPGIPNLPDTNIREIERISEAYFQKIRIIYQNRKLEKQHATNAAIARTTQMFAHDVRSPFSLVLSVFAMVKHAPLENIHELIARYSPEIETKLSRVNGMLSDVLEVSRESEVSKKPNSLHQLVHESVSEVWGNNKVTIHFDLRHKFKLWCDGDKVYRVLVNLLNNAKQAMSIEDSLYISSSDLSDGHIEVRIRNTGSMIDKSKLEKVFEAFYTTKCASGTGLGLAICKKIVEAHGGSITCRSNKQVGVEFCFSLERSLEKDLATEVGVCSFNSVTGSKDLQRSKDISVLSYDEPPRERIEMISSLVEGRCFRILVVDDETIYFDLLRSHLKEFSDEGWKIKMDCISSPEEVEELFGANSYDLVILDVDLGRSNVNGFILGHMLRSHCKDLKICFHSNSGLFDRFVSGREFGGDIFLPKPLTKSHFASLILESLESA